MSQNVQKTLPNDLDPLGGHVVFDSVGKSYDGRSLAVRDVDLSVRRGEFFTLLGPSGSGKTSCLMMLAGFEAPTTGDIRLAGRSLTKIPPYDRNIGLVFQNYALFPHKTVAENVAFPLKVRKRPASEITERVRWILDLVRLGPMADRMPGQLSGGQQQRVALARAMVFDPDLVLMDEPLGALDRQLREHLQIEIRRIQNEIGATVVFVTHDQEEALGMSDRIAIFDGGRLRQAGTPREIYSHPSNAFVAGFIGNSLRFDGVVREADSGLCTIDVPGIGLLNGISVDAGGPGSPAIVSLRPEDVRLAPASATDREAIDVTVRDLSFLGDHVRVGCTHPVAGDLFFSVSPDETAGAAPGSTCRLSWAAGRAKVFASDRPL